jgi:hypothetical protein
MNNATTFYYKPEKLRQEGLKTCPQGYTETVYSGAFNNPYYGFIRMFTLLTTENYPTLMFPAYWTLNPVVCLWFGAFIFIGVYFIQNLLLAIIVELYWKNNKAKLKKEQNYRRERLLKAWNLVDTFGEDRIHCQSERMDTLVKLLRPELSGDKFQEARLELLNSLDQHGDGWVDSYDWMVHGFNLLNLKIEENVATERNPMQRRSSYFTTLGLVDGLKTKLASGMHLYVRFLPHRQTFILCLCTIYTILFGCIAPEMKDANLKELTIKPCTLCGSSA